MLKTYVISVEDSPRIDWMNDQLKKYDDFLDYEFVLQPPGSRLNLLSLAIRGIIRLFPAHKITDKLYDSKSLSYRPGTLGCMLGHYAANQRIVEQNDPLALILEDNAELCEGFEVSVRSALESLHGTRFDILHLFSNKEHNRRNFTDSVYFGDGEWGTAKAQIVSNAFSRFACANIPFHEVADGVTMLPSLRWIPTGLESFVTFPHPVVISKQFHSIRTSYDKNAAKSGVVYRAIRKTACSFVVGFDDGVSTVWDVDEKMHVVTFGICKISCIEGNYKLVSILTGNEIRKVKTQLSLDDITPSRFIDSGETISISCDDDNTVGFCLLSKVDLVTDTGDGYFLAPYLREITIPRIQHEYLSNAVTPLCLYESLYSPMHY